MPSELIAILTAGEPGETGEPGVRDRSLDSVCEGRSVADLVAFCTELEAFWRATPNLYQRVRALFFLYAIHRFHLPARAELPAGSPLSAKGHAELLDRRFTDSIDTFQRELELHGPSDGLSSALARAYRELGFQTLSDQVRHSVRGFAGNRWMFEVSGAADHPLSVRDELFFEVGSERRPVLVERTPVRMDLSHSGWSDIFFLGMDYPEGARVLNVSIDLAVRGRDATPVPPVEARVWVVDKPVLSLSSIDLGCRTEIEELSEVFDYARDYLGLLKAAVISAGVIPPSLEGSGERLADVLGSLVGPGRGLAVESWVRGIPKGSRLAVSTSLLAALISALMRATGQTKELEGPLREPERRFVAARAILGEWLGGSGGGWQDSGGLWPGIKWIEGAFAGPGDPEYGVSRGRLLPNHRVLVDEEVPVSARDALARSLVLVHGGMAQDVGPILEMVTERYLLRSEREWRARLAARPILDRIAEGLSRGDFASVGRATTENFEGPLREIVPWSTGPFTEALIARAAERFGEDFWGFWMLGGMSGGGMGFWFDPKVRDRAADEMQEILTECKKAAEPGVPFAMEPVVYDFAINAEGSLAELETRGDDRETHRDLVFPAVSRGLAARPLARLLQEAGFDQEDHELTRERLCRGDIGLTRNRLSFETRIEDVHPSDLVGTQPGSGGSADHEAFIERGRAALDEGSVGVVTLAGGSGSRWNGGAGTVKALAPLARFAGRYRSFLDVALARSARTSSEYRTPPVHIVTTSYLTHAAIEDYLVARQGATAFPVCASRGGAVGLRFIPTERDLKALWSAAAVQKLDVQAQKVRESEQAALLRWVHEHGEGSDYRDNLAQQCMHPKGHAFELPGLLLNGTLARVLTERPALKTLLLHNVDTLGADLDPALLGAHLAAGHTFTFEVIPRRIDDTGGGLARVDGRVQLVESLALPREEDALALSYYNSMTTWIDIDAWLESMGLDRTHLSDKRQVRFALRNFLGRFPSYVTLKEVKRRWGWGQEDLFWVAQVEKLWSDVCRLPEADTAFCAVSRYRGQQLKEPAQLDGWLRDGSMARVEALCDW